MRGAPQSGLARLIWRISRRISGVMLGLPARRRDFQRQKERKPARCQRRTVSGLNDRKCIQNARCNPIQADEKETVKIA